MPRSTIANRREAAFDKNLELYDYALAAVSATATGTPIALAAEKSITMRAFALYAPGYTGYVAGTAEWVLDVQASTTIAGTYVTVASVSLVGTQQEAEAAFTGNAVAALVPGARFVRAQLRKVGSPGNLKAGVFLAN